MKSLRLLALTLCFLLAIPTALAVRAPFDPWILKVKGDVQYNSKGETAIQSGVIVNAYIADSSITEAKMYPQTAEGSFLERAVLVDFDVTVDGGTAGTYDTGVDLPANALLTDSMIYYSTKFVSAGSTSLAVHCEDANNIFTVRDVTNNDAGDTHNANIQVGTASTWVKNISSACDVIVTQAGSNHTAGKFRLWIPFKIHP